MGGLNFKRLRLQGRIEGSVSKLRAERERFEKKNEILVGSSSGSGSTGSKIKRVASDSPPPAPIATKRRRFMALIDEDEDSSGQEEEDEEGVDVAARHGVRRRRLVKKLGDDFDRVASETEKRKSSPLMDLGNGSEGVALRTRSRKLEEDDASETVMKVVEEVNRSTLKGKKVKSGNKGKSNRGSGSTSVNGVRTSPRLAKRG